MELEEKKVYFIIDKDIIEEFLSHVKPFRPKSNANVHSIIIISDKKDLIEAKIDRMVGLLWKLKQNLESELIKG